MIRNGDLMRRDVEAREHILDRRVRHDDVIGQRVTIEADRRHLHVIHEQRVAALAHADPFDGLFDVNPTDIERPVANPVEVRQNFIARRVQRPLVGADPHIDITSERRTRRKSARDEGIMSKVFRE